MVVGEYEFAVGETGKFIRRKRRTSPAPTPLRFTRSKISSCVILSVDRRERGKNDLSELWTYLLHQRINTQHAPRTPRDRLITTDPQMEQVRYQRSQIHIKSCFSKQPLQPTPNPLRTTSIHVQWRGMQDATSSKQPGASRIIQVFLPSRP
jgi:hypothetical protein